MEYRARGVGKLTNLEPGNGVQHLMQAGWDQQTVDETEDTRTHCASGNNPLTARMDSVLHRWPDVAKDRGQNQTEEACRNRHKTFSTKEAQEVWQFDPRPTVINSPADQTGNDTCQNAHVNFWVYRHHRFRQDEVTDSPGQRRCTRAVF